MDTPTPPPSAPTQSRPPANLPVGGPRPTSTPPPPRPTPAVVTAPVPPPRPATLDVQQPTAPARPPVVPAPARPIASPSIPQATEQIRTMSSDMSGISGVPSAPPLPSSPVPTAPSVTRTAPSIVIPAPSSGSPFRGRTMLYAFVGLAIVGALLYAIVSFSKTDTATTPTPTVAQTTRPSLSPTPTPKPLLSSYFTNTGSPLEFKQNTITAKDVHSLVISSGVPAKMAQRVTFPNAQPPMTAATALRALMNPSLSDSALQSFLGTDWIALTYGQTELYNASGAPTSGVGIRLLTIFEVTNVSAARQQMQAWEAAGLADAGAPLFGYNTSTRIASGFSDGTYRTIPVRYWNFKYADLSLDYAIVTGPSNTNYLVISSSRESLYYALDRLAR